MSTVTNTISGSTQQVEANRSQAIDYCDACGKSRIRAVAIAMTHAGPGNPEREIALCLHHFTVHKKSKTITSYRLNDWYFALIESEKR